MEDPVRTPEPAPHPGSSEMPPWNTGELPEPPRLTARSWALLLGPGLVMGGAAIGGGEWLTGPRISALYGGSLLWLATLSIVGQVFYNLEISRYTLYTGEPIFTGKFRLLPGPRFWLGVYLALDFGSVFPYLATNAATPLAAMILGRLPDVSRGEPSFSLFGRSITDATLMSGLGYLCFLAILVPLLVGGKVYDSMKAVMSFKIVVVLGFLTNTAISSYTRDQGWGMGRLVGALPSVIGGQRFSLSHVGTVFLVTAESRRRFRRWYRHVLRDQLVVWMPACFLGLALPSMLSVQFLRRGTEVPEAAVAGMTAQGVAQAVGPAWGPYFWFMVMFCGLLVLAPSAATTADGVLRRWVEMFWTASKRLRRLDPHRIRQVYFGVLCAYGAFGLAAIYLGRPDRLLLWATTIYNFALGVSCLHVLAVNVVLLPAAAARLAHPRGSGAFRRVLPGSGRARHPQELRLRGLKGPLTPMEGGSTVARFPPRIARPWKCGLHAAFRGVTGPKEKEKSMYRRSALALGAVVVLAAPGLAQEAPSGAPPVVVITQEEIKPGSMSAHEKQVASYLALFERAKVQTNRLGLQPVSGDTNHVVYLQGYESYADMEAANKKEEDVIAANPAWQAELDQLEKQTGPLHASQRSMIAVFRADLSYRPLKMDGVAKSRYFSMSTSQLKPGRGADYVDYVKQLNRAREKAQIADIHTAVYQVVSGGPGGTYVTFTLNRTLAEQDDFRKGMEARNKAIDEAIGGESVVKARSERAEQIFAEGSGTSVLYSVNRKISQPSPQFAALDAEFWTPKPAPAKAMAAKKEEKKP